MKSFLTELAEQLYDRYGRKMSQVTVLFPSQRARLFFTEALREVSGGAVWSPRFATIDELMCSISQLHSADNLRLVSELYVVYSLHHKEEFDSFYHWGQMLIADFDMVDKYMVDAEQLFVNIADIKEIESDLSYLTEEQQHYLARFWKSVHTDRTPSEQKEYFLKIWRSLPEIYTQYKQRLRSLGIGYTGMIYRDAAERIAQSSSLLLEQRGYVVAGFNALSACEQRLFDYLKTAHDAVFAWDYSDYYYDNSVQEAGRFMRQNVERYPSTLNISHRDMRECVKGVTVASTSTAVAQCSYLSTLLTQLAERDKDGEIKPLDRNTAIVLTDENLLMPLLYALPDELKGTTEDGKAGINITMGYPLRVTFAYSFVERLLELQSHARTTETGDTFYYADVDGLLSHPYLAQADNSNIAAIKKRIVDERIYNVPAQMLSEVAMAEQIFTVQQSAQGLLSYLDTVLSTLLEATEATDQNRLRVEYIIRIRTTLRQVANMVSGCSIELSIKLCTSLIRRHLQQVRIPFEGEPLEGLQVMGILETRNLDFKNVILLSMSDSNFPGTRITDNSYIPYSLRYAYNLPTQEHHQGVFGYYFYRLIERAERVWMVYCSTSDEKGTGEPSRYIRQISYESGLPIETVKVVNEANVVRTGALSVVKDSYTMQKLQRYTDGENTLSPTAISTYVKCPLSFYYHYIVGVKEQDTLEENLDNKDFGNIFHDAADRLYQKIKGKAGVDAELGRITDACINQCVDEAIAKICFKSESLEGHTLSGELTIVRHIVIRYLKNNLIAYDKAHPNFVVKEVEKTFSHPFTFTSAGQQLTVTLEGRADRIDSLDSGALRIIDYKTGSQNLNISSFDNLFNGSDAQRESKHINTLMYAMIARRKYGREVQPALYFLRSMYDMEYSPLLCHGVPNSDPGKKRNIMVGIERYSDVADAFESYVLKTLSDIFDPSVPFCQAEDDKACTYCDYARICDKVKRSYD
ncbi:MAG: PD-(D/E)XK nuclease family protein [Alistipes sp.]|nr:PD-(D/E)XK nuclease family protein [Alistipes sp.]